MAHTATTWHLTAGKWLLAGLMIFAFLHEVLDQMAYSDSWSDFLAPHVAGLGFVIAAVLAARYPKVSGACLGLAVAVAVGYFAFKLVGHWRFFLDNWAITLVILYLPLMLIGWFAYQAWEARRK